MDFKLFTIERKGFIFKNYEVYDDPRLRYRIKRFGWGIMRKFKIEDHNGLEVLQIHRPLSPFKMVFAINNYDEIIAEVKKEFGILKSDLSIESKYGNYRTTGNFRQNNFTVLREGEEVAKISRQNNIVKRTYGLAISESEDPLFILGIAMIIKIMIRVKRSRKSG